MSTSVPSSPPTSVVDESLYSRQLYVLGHEAQARLSLARVLLLGLGGLGLEVAKNLALAGVHSLTLCDDSRCRVEDAGSSWAVTEADVREGRSRASAALPALQPLNPNVRCSLAANVDPLSLLNDPSSPISVVCVCGPLLSLSPQLRLSAECRARGVSLVSASASGLFGRCFVDVGCGFTVLDATGEQLSRGLISHVTSASPCGVVTCHEEGRHRLSDGDLVTFEEVEGMVELNHSQPRPVRVLSPFTFSIEDTSSYHPFTGHRGYFQQVQRPRVVDCQPLQEQLLRPTLVQTFTIEPQLHALFMAIEEHRKEMGEQPLPAPLPLSSVQRVLQLIDELGPRLSPPLSPLSPSEASLLGRLARISSCELSPVCAVMGGVVAQEVLKAVTGKFTPLQQWLYLDASHALPESDPQETDGAQPDELASHSSSSLPFSVARLSHQSLVFGAALSARLSSVHHFLVGAGAIGCEMLKALALMGVGRVTVTDMDLIERSNLNRQFLFRTTDVGQLKALVAAREAMRINPACHVTAQSLRVGPSSEEVYDDAFWGDVDCVITALDNVEARLFLDQRCVYYQRAMIDSGTLGSKGSVQVIVPHLTESYGASRDPPEESIPICTLRNFPNKIEHAIQWAREAFEGHFLTTPSAVNSLLVNGQAYVDDMQSRPHEALAVLSSVHDALLVERPASYAECVQWARMQFEVEYVHKTLQLLHVFPADSTTSEGIPFWSATKRQPQPLTFDTHDATHLDYVRSAARLRATVYNLNLPASEEEELRIIARAVADTRLPPLQVGSAKIATTDAEAKAMEEKAALEDSEGSHERCQQLSQALLTFRASQPTFRPLRPLEFDKDDDSNGHLRYIAAAANLRARSYRISEENLHTVKLIAGKIIPAIATTTALVTGLVCLELLKWTERRRQLSAYRNSTVNLALPFLASAEPLPAATSTAAFPLGSWKWSQWDRIEVDEGRELTLEQLMQLLKQRFGVDCSMLSHGAAMLYYSFGNKKKMKERQKQTLSAIVHEVTGKALPHTQRHIILEACVNAPGGEDIDIPFIRYTRHARA